MSKMLEDLAEVVPKVMSEDGAWGSIEAMDFIKAHHATIRDMAKRMEILQHELDHARACRDRGVQILCGIHALLYPPAHTNDEDVTFVFHSPHVHEQMQALSDRIRAIPEAIDSMQESNP